MADSPSELQVEIEKLESRHAEHPEGRFFVPLANAYRKIGELDHAEALLREGLRQHPDYLSAHIVLGRCLADRGATQEAADEFRYVLTMDPQNLIALRTLGELSVSAGRRDEAARWYEQLLAVDPMNEDARRALESLPGESSLAPDGEFQATAAWWEAPSDEPASEPAGLGTGQAEPPIHATAPTDSTGDDLGAGDLPTLAGFDSGFGTPAPELETLGGALGLDDDEPPADDESLGGEVVTETIAELYARQGLHDRAAEVYRELIRRRGGDATLEQRLAELERQTSGAAEPPAPAPPAPEPVAEPIQLETVRPDLGTELPGLGTDLPGWAVPEPEPELRAGDDLPVAGFATPARDAESDGGHDDDLPLVGAFDGSFEGGFADDQAEPAAGDDAFWAPEPAAETEAAPALDAAMPGPAIAELLREVVAWRPTETGGTADAIPVYAAPEPIRGVEETVPSILDEPLSELSGTPPAAADAFPWEGAAAAETPAEEAPAGEDLFSFDHFFAESAPQESPPAPEPTEAPSPPAAAAKEEEDDLESFQAWLRSLKR